jgi:hypothetical protein
MVRRLICFQVCLLLISGFPILSCQRSEHVIMGNEGLRLTPEEIKKCEDAANNGDADCAKKLWYHYEFVTYDHEKGDMWRRNYETLTKGRRQKMMAGHLANKPSYPLGAPIRITT